jgi:hypothetical protein|tara:strand:- start:887 stop:1021 length:135 start_codon:yes stop_codon:yes gene_type:complete
MSFKLLIVFSVVMMLSACGGGSGSSSGDTGIVLGQTKFDNDTME